MGERECLETLYIVISQGYGPPEPADPPLPASPLTTFPSITTLNVTVSRAFIIDNFLPGLPDFAPSFTSFSSLSFSALCESFVEATGFLTALPHPDKLRHLTLDSEANVDLLFTLPSFVGLESLTLSRVDQIDDEFFDALRQLPRLEKLVITGDIAYDDAQVVLEDLAAFVSPGRRRHPALKHLHLDHLSAVLPLVTVWEFGPSWYAKAMRWAAHRDPAREQYTFREGDVAILEAVFAGANACGIEVSGNAKEKAEILKAYAKEKELVCRGKVGKRTATLFPGRAGLLYQAAVQGEALERRNATH